jgi:hypothetical protein
MEISWLAELQDWIREQPAAVIRLSSEEFERLSDSRRGLTEFTMARSHAFFERVKVPTLCFVFGTSTVYRNRKTYEDEVCLAGIVSSRTRITSLETRVKITRALRLKAMNPDDLTSLLKGTVHQRNLEQRLTSEDSFVLLSPEMSSVLIGELAESAENADILRTVSTGLRRTKRFSGARALQEDAIQTALRAFGLEADAGATELDMQNEQASAITGVPVREDTIIQNDARSIPGFSYVGGDITGRAVFERANGRLEIITANRQPLEEVFGVDLIYLNLSQKNLVMVQYKMLDRVGSGFDGDWIYRPDGNLASEVARMDTFSKLASGSTQEYRLNSDVFYLKFVKRDGLLTNGSIVTPLEHFKQFINLPGARGPRDGVRISYDSLEGSYMRHGTFIDLMQAGYIGSYADDTQNFQVLIEEVMRNNRSVVAAIQTSTRSDDQVYKRPSRYGS